MNTKPYSKPKSKKRKSTSTGAKKEYTSFNGVEIVTKTRRRHPRQQCKFKVKYSSIEHVTEYVLNSGIKLVAYQCPRCKFWHCGHKIGSNPHRNHVKSFDGTFCVDCGVDLI